MLQRAVIFRPQHGLGTVDTVDRNSPSWHGSLRRYIRMQLRWLNVRYILTCCYRAKASGAGRVSSPMVPYGFVIEAGLSSRQMKWGGRKTAAMSYCSRDSALLYFVS